MSDMQCGANLKLNLDLRAVLVQNDASGVGSSHAGIAAKLLTGRDRPNGPVDVVPDLWSWCLARHLVGSTVCAVAQSSGHGRWTEWRIPGIFDLFGQAVSHILPGNYVINS